jgi:hypothetical protein
MGISECESDRSAGRNPAQPIVQAMSQMPKRAQAKNRWEDAPAMTHGTFAMKSALS